MADCIDLGSLNETFTQSQSLESQWGNLVIFSATSILAISEVLNLDFGEFMQSYEAEIYQNQNSGPLKPSKWQILALKNC